MRNRFFFYGTLMSGHRRHGWMETMARPVGNASIPGQIYSVSGSFPALVDAPGTVVGEVWEALPGMLGTMLHNLDMIEGFNEGHPDWSMYLREWRTLDDGSEAYVYVWNRGVGMHMERIESGDWRNRQEEAWNECPACGANDCTPATCLGEAEWERVS